MESLKFFIFMKISFVLINVTFGSYIQPKFVETLDPKVATEIFSDHWVYQPQNASGSFKQNHVCESIDEKTNRIYGEAVCKEAIRKFKGQNVVLAERTKCEDILLKEPNLSESSTEINEHLLRMAKCTYEYLLEDYGFFYLYNSPKTDYYYLFIKSPFEENNFTIHACLHIPIQANDFSEITIRETQNPDVADDIFGYYGQETKKKLTRNYSSFPVGNLSISLDEICVKVQKLEEYQFTEIENFKFPAKFTEARVVRKLSSPFDLEIQKSSPTQMIKCDYEGGYFFVLANGPSRNYYYIAEKAATKNRNEVEIKAVVYLPLED